MIILNNKILHIIIFATGIAFNACSPRIISEKYYFQHKDVIDQIEESYRTLYKHKPFTVAFSDKYFQLITLEIKTDSLTYVYSFGLEEKRIRDSMYKYGLKVPETLELIRKMRSIRCTWVNNFVHYEEGNQKSLTFISIKPTSLNSFFSSKKYYILTYFSQPQYYDKEGRLLDDRKQRQLQKLNGEVFKRINDSVCYTISSNYR